MKTLTKSVLLIGLFTALSLISYSQTNQNDKNMNNKPSRTVVFIHGAFVSSECWNEWKAYFESKGYNVLTPPWPYKDAPAATLRSRQPDAKVASLRLAGLIDHYDKFVQELPGKPIVIGHSLGGLIVQKLVNRGHVVAGVAIHSVPPKGVITLKPSFFRSTSAALGFFTSTRKTYQMTFKQWQYAFTNGMPLDQQKAGYEAQSVPESKMLIRDILGSDSKIDFKKQHVPLLFTSGTTDHCVPASLTSSIVKRYKKNQPNSITDLKEFTNRNHFVLSQPTWKEDADYILDWLAHHVSENNGKSVAKMQLN